MNDMGMDEMNKNMSEAGKGEAGMVVDKGGAGMVVDKEVDKVVAVGVGKGVADMVYKNIHSVYLHNIRYK